MPEFVHELLDAKALFETVGVERSLTPALVEKDYWVMHCLWALQRQCLIFELKGGTSLSKGWGCIDRFSEDLDIRFEPPGELNTKGEKSVDVAARFEFYEHLAEQIDIPGILVERNHAFDDEKARNAGISLKYSTHFEPLPELKPEVLLEVGFARTAPNEPREFSSWAFERAIEARVDVVDNRATAVRCFNPEYTFVDKIQTICKKFRQHRDGGEDVERPRQFMRHYYDLYRLLELERVKSFIGTSDYEIYKQEKLRGQDLKEFENRNAFVITDDETYFLFEKEFESMNTLLLSSGPTFKDVMGRIRKYSGEF